MERILAIAKDAMRAARVEAKEIWGDIAEIWGDIAEIWGVASAARRGDERPMGAATAQLDLCGLRPGPTTQATNAMAAEPADLNETVVRQKRLSDDFAQKQRNHFTKFKARARGGVGAKLAEAADSAKKGLLSGSLLIMSDN